MAILSTSLQKMINFKNYYRCTILSNSYLNARTLKICSSVLRVNEDIYKLGEKDYTIEISKSLRPFVTRSVEEVLSLMGKVNLLPNETVMLLKALRIQTMFKKVNPNLILNDDRFDIICKFFRTSCFKIRPHLLISGLRSLLEIGVPPDSGYVMEAEERIISKISMFTFSDLVVCLHFHQNYMHTKLQEQVVSNLVHEIQERANELNTTTDVLMILQVFNFFDLQTKKHFESKIIKLSELFTLPQMTKTLLILAEKSIRSKMIINAVSQHICENFEKPKLKDVIDILYALRTLNYCEENIISYLLDNQISAIPSITEPLLISRLMTVCGHLKWRHSEILDACGEWIMNNIEACQQRVLTAYILTTAALNYSSTKSNTYLQFILPYLSQQNVKPDLWLDIVWSQAILNNVKRETLQEVLSKDFYESLERSNFKAVSNKLKLMNLKGYMQMKFPECIFGCNLLLDQIEVSQSQEERKCREIVIEALSNFVLKGKYLYTNQSTDLGLFIDAEFILDSKEKPLLLSDYGLLDQTSKSFRPLPKGAKRCALLVLFYNNFTLNEPILNGKTALTVQILSNKYDNVIQIPFDEFIKNKTELEKTKYLSKKIKKQ